MDFSAPLPVPQALTPPTNASHSPSVISSSTRAGPRRRRSAGPNPSWDEFYDRLVSYRQAHGHTRVPRSYKLDPKLAQWVVNQRTYYEQLKRGKYSFLNEERIDLLEEIGFEWKIDQTTRWTQEETEEKVPGIIEATEIIRTVGLVVRECSEQIRGTMDDQIKEMEKARKPKAALVSELAKAAYAVTNTKKKFKSKAARQETICEDLEKRFSEILLSSMMPVLSSTQESAAGTSSERDAGGATDNVPDDVQCATSLLEKGADVLQRVQDVLSVATAELFLRASYSKPLVDSIRDQVRERRKTELMRASVDERQVRRTVSGRWAKPTYQARMLLAHVRLNTKELEQVKKKDQDRKRRAIQQKQNKRRRMGETGAMAEGAEIGGRTAEGANNDGDLANLPTVSFPYPRDGKAYNPVELCNLLEGISDNKKRSAAVEEIINRGLVPVARSSIYKTIQKHKAGKAIKPEWNMRGRNPVPCLTENVASSSRSMGSKGTTSADEAISNSSVAKETSRSQLGTMISNDSPDPGPSVTGPTEKRIVVTICPRKQGAAAQNGASLAKRDGPPPPTADELGLPSLEKGKIYTPRDVVAIMATVQDQPKRRIEICKCLVHYGLVPVSRSSIDKIIRKYKTPEEAPAGWFRIGPRKHLETEELQALVEEVGGADYVSYDDVVSAVQQKLGIVPSRKSVLKYLASIRLTPLDEDMEFQN